MYFQSLMKQSSLDDPGLGMEYEGGEPTNNATTNEGDGELIIFCGPAGSSWNQSYYEENNPSQMGQTFNPQIVKGKGNIFCCN